MLKMLKMKKVLAVLKYEIIFILTESFQYLFHSLNSIYYITIISIWLYKEYWKESKQYNSSIICRI